MSSTTVLAGNFERDVSPRSFYELGTLGRGPLTTSGVQASGIISSSLAKARGEKDWPDLQLYFSGISVGKNTAEALARAYHLKRSEMISYYTTAVNKNSFSQIVSLGRPKSRGHISLTSSSPNAPLHIDPNYLEDEEDVRVLVEGKLSNYTSNLSPQFTSFKIKV